MNEQQLKQTLADIAAQAVPADTDVWPAMQTKLTARKRPFSRGIEPLLRLAGAGVALAAVAFFLFWLAGLPQMMAPQPASPAMQPIGGFEAVAAPLSYPDSPETLPGYRVHPVSAPDTPAEALAWAQNFGLPDAKLYRDPRSLETLIALGSDGSRLSFREGDQLMTPVDYARRNWFEANEGETLTFAAATQVAESFLAAHNLLPQPYQVRDIFSAMHMADGFPPRQLLVTPDLDGYALYSPDGASVGATLLLDPQGEVFWGEFLPVEIEQTGMISVRPAEEVVADFVNGRLDPLYLNILPTATEQSSRSTHYHPPLPSHTVGEAVTILETGDTYFLVAEDGSEIRATLHTGEGAQYELLTPDLAEIVNQIEYSELLVTGTIAAQTAPDTWQLEVASWKIIPQQAFTFSGCAVGAVEIDEDGDAWVMAEQVMGRLVQNGRYHVPHLPTAIQNGERIEVCSQKQLEPSETLTWQIIYAPPRWEFYKNGSLQEPAAIELAASPYELGETAVLTGVVTADIYPSSKDETLSLWLIADLPDSEIGHIYPLLGDESQLQAIAADFSGQMVQVTGTITTTISASEGEQVLAVSTVSQPWTQPPTSTYAEKVLLTLGQMELDTLQAEFAELQEAQGVLVVEEVELAYYFDVNGAGETAALSGTETAVPVWVVRGRSQDRQDRFMAYLPATE